jgi:alpha-galactosidase
MKKFIFTFLFFAAIALTALAQKYPGLALTPPMGWNSWNTFACNINEKMIKEMADAMVSSGMRDAGYKYLILDDCWLAPTRDSLQNLQADPKKFPDGMKAIGDYIHSKGLKFGIYNCAGTKTCAGYPGTRGHEYQDALTYASWGVDYLKFDWCNTEGINAKEAYTTMSKAMAATHRPIVFSMCEWGTNQPWLWGAPISELWRTTTDIARGWYIKPIPNEWTPLGFTQIIDKEVNLRQYAGPGHWNDPDMLEVGNGMPVNEDRAHFSMWAMLAAPLIAGNDLRHMSEETREILTKRGVIAVDQDSLGIQALRFAVKDSVETWMKPLKSGDWAVCFLNRAAEPKAIDFDWKANVVKDTLSNRELNANTKRYAIVDLWANKALGSTEKALQGTVLSHDVLMVYLSYQIKKK